MTFAPETSPTQNLQQLYEATAWIYAMLQACLEPETTEPIPETPPICPSLKQLSRLFGLSAFEEKVILLCAALDLEPACAQLFARLAGNPQQPYPTIGLALSLFPDATWTLLDSQRPLLHWQLLTLEAQPNPTQARIALDPRILNYLLGVSGLDNQLKGWITPMLSAAALHLPPSQAEIVTQVARTWKGGEFLALQLCGFEQPMKIAIAQAIAQQLGFGLYQLQAGILPTNPHDNYSLKQRWLREAMLSRGVLFIAQARGASPQAEREQALAAWLNDLEIPLILSTSSRQSLPGRASLTYELSSLPHAEKRTLWGQYLGDRATELNGQLESIVAQFNLNSHTIRSVCASMQDVNPADMPDRLWDSCRTQARPQLEHLAQRIPCTATWDELILPQREKEMLRTIARQVKQRAKVYETWGFASKSARGLGISALFAGPSGTGKTMAAEVLAQEFKLDLYRIDLSAVSSKYIGETEKNLRQIFDAAESGGAVLLFDEADALFGKRTQVKNSHDRHANLEVSYLLQRMEAYQGLAILTTNLKDSLDQAFIRRLRFILNFPYPEKASRSEIWARIFPSQTPTEGLDYELLGQLDMAGGNIRAIALNSAFIAADAGEPVMMKHILTAAKSEGIKVGRSLSREETQYWLD
ncbi:MAG: ATP-binding protein [Spirulina sp. SIO3F2]|nr:ATP-binding protein [Spirulina sp. SIO3F2]